MRTSSVSSSDLEDLVAELDLFPEQRISTLLDLLREQEEDLVNGEDDQEED